jgi:hypothetical protein
LGTKADDEFVTDTLRDVKKDKDEREACVNWTDDSGGFWWRERTGRGAKCQAKWRFAHLSKWSGHGSKHLPNLQPPDPDKLVFLS